MVRDLGRAAVLIGLDVEELRVDRRHRVVDPDVDWPELLLRRLCRRLDLVGVGDIGGEDESAAAELLDLARRRFQPAAAACEQGDLRAVLREPARGRAPDSAGSARDDDDVAHRLSIFRRAGDAKPLAVENLHCVAVLQLVVRADYNVAYLYYLRGEYTRALDLYRVAHEQCEQSGDAYHSALCDLDHRRVLIAPLLEQIEGGDDESL